MEPEQNIPGADILTDDCSSAQRQWQRLDQFRLPADFRGRPAWLVQVWWLIQATLFGWSPQFLFGWRRWLLRAFGAEIGCGVRIRPSARITYPWKVRIGDHVWIGDDAVLYSLGEIAIGSHSVISQRCYLCAASHHTNRIGFDIFASPVTIADQCWLATDVFVAPGVTIGRGTVVGARASVFSDLLPEVIAHGTPARAIRPRDSKPCA